MATKAIEMLDNTQDSAKRRLGLGTVHLVPGEVSAADADILIKAGKAKAVEPPAGADATALTVAQIKAELTHRKVAYEKTANKATLLALLKANQGG